MKITVISVIRNEGIIIPFFLRHYRPVVDRFIFYDDASTDDTRDLIRAHPNTELHDNPAGGVLDDVTNITIKNTVYQHEPGDWFFMPDADEFLFHPDLRGLLERYDRQGVTLPRVEGWDMVSDYIPSAEHSLLTDHIKFGVRNAFMDKMIVVHAGVIMNWEPGAHTHHASPHVESEQADIKLLHYKYLSKSYVIVKATTHPLSARNHALKLGYTDGRPSSESWEKYYDENWPRRVRVIP